MSQYQGGFFPPDPNSPFGGQQQGGYPPQPPQGPGSAYPPASGSFYPPQDPGLPPPQQPGYPHDHAQGYPPQNMGYPQHVSGGYPPQQPFGGVAAGPMPGSGLPYGLAPNSAPSHQSGYPSSNMPSYPTHPGANSYQQMGAYPSASVGSSPYAPAAAGSLVNSAGMQAYPGSGHPTGQTGSNQVELSVSCINLKDEDMMSKSDPVCVAFEKRAGNWVEIGRTEMIPNTHNPRWQKKFVLHCNNQTAQEMKFEIYDWDSKSQKLKRHDILGLVEVSLGTIVSSPGKQFVSSLKGGRGGRITIMADDVGRGGNAVVKLQLMAQKLDNKDTFSKSDPFFQISKKMPGGQWSLVYKSEVINNNCNPKWAPLQKSISELCNGDLDRELNISILDHDSNGQNDLIGGFTTSLQSLSTGVRNQTRYEVINPKKQRTKRHYTNSGVVSVIQYSCQ